MTDAPGTPPSAPRAEHGETDWALVDASEAASTLGVDAATGLSAADAVDRRERFGANVLDAAPPEPAWRRILRQFADPLIYLLLGAVVISAVAWAFEGAHGVPIDAIVIIVIVVANAILGYVQEAKAADAVAALQGMAAVSATVVRDGRAEQVPASELVPGDILALAEGDSVGADARLLSSSSLQIAEASLTGESVPVTKSVATLPQPVPLGDRSNMVFKGTAVTQGVGRAVVTATGMQTEMGHIATMLAQTEQEPTPLQKEIAGVSRTLGIAVIVIAIVVMGAIGFTSGIGSLQEGVDVLLVGVSLAVAAVPEGLPAILSVVLSIGVQAMSRQGAIIKHLSSVETLGSATVICSDKTGTLTRNEMTMLRVHTGSGATDITGVGYAPDGDVLVDGSPLLDSDPELDLREEDIVVLSGGTLASDAEVRQDADGSWIVVGDPTEAAFVVAERKAGLTERRERRFTRIGEVPFTSERKMMSVIVEDAEHPLPDGGRGRPVLIAKGAPDVLLQHCTHVRTGMEVADAHRRRPRARPRVGRLDVGTGAPHPRGRVPSARGRRARIRHGCGGGPRPGGRDRARGGPHLRRHGRHHRPAALRGGDGHRGGAPRGHPGGHDHRRPPRHGAAHRAGARHRDPGRPGGHRPGARRDGRGCAARDRARRVGVRARRARAQAAAHRRAAGRRADRLDDGRRRERRPGAQAGRHRRRDGDHRHRGLEGGRGDDPHRRQLRDDRGGGARRAG